MKRFVAACAMAVVLVACDPYGVYWLDVEVPGWPTSGSIYPHGYQVGDTVVFLATERYAEGSHGSPAEPSSSDPGAYSWRSSDESVIQVLSAGRIRMRGPGRAWLSVATGHANAHQDVEIVVVPRVAGVRITPESAAIAVGDTISFLVTALDSAGETIPEIGRPSGTASYDLPDSHGGNSDPVAANIVTTDMTRYLFRGFRPGVVTVVGVLPIYGATALQAPARLEVR